MRGFAVKGWCPAALRPMRSGDGLLVRVKPRLARLERDQVRGLCTAAVKHGSGIVEVTRRANLQIRGIDDGHYEALIDDLDRLGLIDADADTEARRSILVTPFWQEGDDTWRLAMELERRLDALPLLPDKFGFALDAGPLPALTDIPADLRIERGADGGLILRAEGRSHGLPVAPEKAIDALIALARWFAESGGMEAGRMARFHAPLPDWAQGKAWPAPSAAALFPGPTETGHAYGLAFGQIEAERLAAFMDDSGADALRLTPWRMIIAEGGRPSAVPGFLSDPDAAQLRSDACPGLPHCPQASVETRALATRLAPFVKGRLHVSGCAKGCARLLPADVVLTGRDGRYDLAFNARAGDTPVRRGLSATDVLAYFGAG